MLEAEEEETGAEKEKSWYGKEENAEKNNDYESNISTILENQVHRSNLVWCC